MGNQASFVALLQGVYYLLTGVWPFLSAQSFQRVTGPKTDFWLAKTVGILVAVIGVILLRAGIRRQITPDTPILAIGSASSLAAIDITYVLIQRIREVYLLDAFAELALVVAWGFALRRQQEKG